MRALILYLCTAAAIACTVATQPAWAGFIEVGGSGSFRRSNIDKNAYDESASITGSLSYYLSEMSALELSYTDGASKRFIGSTNGQDHVTHSYYRMVGLDFVYTFGEQDAPLRPYLKGGAAYLLEKRLVDQFQGFAASTTEDQPSLVPSAGVGVRIALTRTLSIKLGLEGWMSGNGSTDIDYSARAGLSLLF